MLNYDPHMHADICLRHEWQEIPGRRVDYKASSDIVLPVAKRSRQQRRTESELYPVEVVERDEETYKVKVHYIGYGSSDDEWKDGDIVDLTMHMGC